MTKFVVEVVSEIQVTLDESKFTPEFMESYRQHFYSSVTSIEHHARHLAQLQARGIVDRPQINNGFIEGYGNVQEFGVEIETIDIETQIVGRISPGPQRIVRP